MRRIRHFVLAVCVLLLGAGAAFAGINAKEVGALLIYPEYWATTTPTVQETYITVTNDKTSDVNAHIEVVGANFCGDCNFNVPLTGQQTKRLLFRALGTEVGIYDASDFDDFPYPGRLLNICPEQRGFVVVSLEEFGLPCGRTLGENMLHGDLVVINFTLSDTYQTGAISIQAAGAGNNGDRVFDFNNMEYAAFPSILTGNFWADIPTMPLVEPRLTLFNVNRMTADPVIANTHCSVTYVDAKEEDKSTAFNFGCWFSRPLVDIGPGTSRLALGTENGYFWLRCDPGTHGSLKTQISGAPYPPGGSDFGDTLFQSTTRSGDATLRITPRTNCGG